MTGGFWIPVEDILTLDTAIALPFQHIYWVALPPLTHYGRTAMGDDLYASHRVAWDPKRGSLVPIRQMNFVRFQGFSD